MASLICPLCSKLQRVRLTRGVRIADVQCEACSHVGLKMTEYDIASKTYVERKSKSRGKQKRCGRCSRIVLSRYNIVRLPLLVLKEYATRQQMELQPGAIICYRCDHCVMTLHYGGSSEGLEVLWDMETCQPVRADGEPVFEPEKTIESIESAVKDWMDNDPKMQEFFGTNAQHDPVEFDD